MLPQDIFSQMFWEIFITQHGMAKSGAGGFLKRNLEAYIFRFLRFMFQCWTGKKSGDNDCKNRRTFTSPYYIYQQ